MIALLVPPEIGQAAVHLPAAPQSHDAATAGTRGFIWDTCCSFYSTPVDPCCAHDHPPFRVSKSDSSSGLQSCPLVRHLGQLIITLCETEPYWWPYSALASTCRLASGRWLEARRSTGQEEKEIAQEEYTTEGRGASIGDSFQVPQLLPVLRLRASSVERFEPKHRISASTAGLPAQPEYAMLLSV
jgi:hypothetical protein